MTQETTDLLQELITEGWILPCNRHSPRIVCSVGYDSAILRFVLPHAAPVPSVDREDTLGRPQNLLSGLFISPHLEDVNILHKRPKSKSLPQQNDDVYFLYWISTKNFLKDVKAIEATYSSLTEC
jgi:hypothetical protein